jgi:RNA polymerase sigma-70 factor (ECF subfamily)
VTGTRIDSILKKSELFAFFGIIVGQMGNRLNSQTETGAALPGRDVSLSLPDRIASYGDRLLRSAYLMCGNYRDAQDIVQETLCRALAALPDFRGEAGVYTWLFSIMRNVYRKQRRHEIRFFHFLARQPRVELAEENPADHWERRSTQTQLLAMLRKLPAKQREIVILRFVNDLKIADIARILSLPEGTVKSRLFKAGNRLQELMGTCSSRSISECEEAHEV